MPTKVTKRPPARSSKRPAPTKKSKPAARPSKTTVTKKTNASKPKAPTDSVKKSAGAGESPKASSNGRSMLGGIFDAFGGLGRKAAGSVKPLDFSPAEKEAGQAASDTLGRMAGNDGKWTADDLGRNFAQIQFPRGIKGTIARGLTASRLMETHGLDPDNQEARNNIMKQGMDLAKENPGIAKLHRLEGMNTDGFSPEKQARYDELVGGLRKDLGGKGLLPVSVKDMQDFGKSADLLQDKLGERGIEPPKPGTPVDVDQFRGLFEGQSPLRSMF